jgi:hypothetical protein
MNIMQGAANGDGGMVCHVTRGLPALAQAARATCRGTCHVSPGQGVPPLIESLFLTKIFAGGLF